MLIRLATGFCIVLVFALCADASDPNTNELIGMYEKSLSVLETSAYEIESNMKVEGVENPKAPKFLKRKSILYRDGNRWASIAEDRYTFEDPQRPVEVSHYTGIVDNRYIRYESDGNEPAGAVYMDSDLESGRAKARATLGGGIIAEGYILGNGTARLPDILRNSSTLKIRDDRPEIDGYPTYVLESIGENGKIILWLDPESGFHARRIEVYKSGEDLLDRRAMSSIRSESNIAYNKQLEKYSVVVDSVKIEKIDGVFIMTEANMTETQTYSDGHEIHATCDFKRSKIDLNPDFDALRAFEIKVPDGTPVYDIDFEAANFVVLNGKIVHPDDPTFEEIDRTVEELKNK
jgi:hypothetical protein